MYGLLEDAMTLAYLATTASHSQDCADGGVDGPYGAGAFSDRCNDSFHRACPYVACGENGRDTCSAAVRAQLDEMVAVIGG
jgi:hypothetical protein